MYRQKIKEELLSAHILIIEDDDLSRLIIAEIFKKQGFTNIVLARNGVEGLHKALTCSPDIIILDVLMPDMDGIECCWRIRGHENPDIANVPVVFQTALDGLGEKAKLFAAGATDYITKPVDPHELTSRVLIHLEREVVYRKLKDINMRMTTELETARATQQLLMPDRKEMSAIEQNYGLFIHGHYQPCNELGGDFWGLKQITPHALAVYMVDFSGHGVNAALNVFRLHSLFNTLNENAESPDIFVSCMNRELVKMLPKGQFCTMFYGIINTAANMLTYVCAAAPEPLIVSQTSKECHFLENTGPLLGAFKESGFTQRQIPFMPGDSLFLYSDALIETPDAKGGMMTLETVANAFKNGLKAQSSNGAGGGGMDSILNLFQQKYATRQCDDLTLCSIYRNEA